MNRILLICFLLLCSSTFSQEKNNPFNTSETEIYSTSEITQNQFAAVDNENYESFVTGTGPPGDDDNSVPVNNYIPFLFVAAIIGIIYFQTKKQTASS